ncbi:hypothetical protein HO133_002949 [Letharia lupina]|uniref:FAD/NAD(P)-binding domain-containing protein n=1 Tax=Letharia lupina TaxID=560253 RepID=A0A8H6CC04_9LECA|nr:uncharacterized protein HO133_002949 [Letharia lupina]KAF6220516.1 hypothetical protein HO133_002949 [Letharia lupina]
MAQNAEPMARLEPRMDDIENLNHAVASHLNVQAANASSLPTSSSISLRKDHLRTRKDQSAQSGGVPQDIETDILIVGAGFGGVYLLHRLRDELGFNVKCFEAGKDLGGIWHWNCYPGARVDSPIPVYEYSLEKVWKNWSWSCKYPGWQELRRYFDHVEQQLQVKKDVVFESAVVSSEWDEKRPGWTVKTEDGKTARCRYLILATGFAAKRNFPDWPGLDTFEGAIHHSSFWPEEDVDVAGKKVAVIGTGSTGIQIAQECAKRAKELTVFQRTPNLCLPMQQASLTSKEQEDRKFDYEQFFRDRKSTFAGFPFDYIQKNTLDDSSEEREKFFEQLWEEGGFKLWLATYKDMLYDKEANRHHYDFWAKKTRARITDPAIADILAPLEPPHAFGTKRPSLEQDFYEQFNKPNVHVIDVNKNPVIEVRPRGLVTADGKLHEVDLIALATGFDSVTGGMKNMGLKDINGKPLAEKWAMGTWSYLGTTCNGFPNMFFLYGAQGPTAFSNGPTCVEVQGDWIVDSIRKMRDESIQSIEATREAEEDWRRKVTELSDKTLFPSANSWYMGANIPGKPREQLCYAGGLPLYQKELKESLDEGFKGFVVVNA